MPVEGDAFLGVGWSFPPLFTAQGKEVKTTSGPENVHKSVWIILNTRLGERVLLEGFGAGLQNLQYEPLNARLINNLKRMIKNSILRHEPRVILDNVGVSAPREQQGVLMVQLQYTVKATNSRFNLVYPFYLEGNR